LFSDRGGFRFGKEFSMENMDWNPFKKINMDWNYETY
jgi:hypothetical protein